MNARDAKVFYFLNMAKFVATQSTCPRRSVGAVITTEDSFVISTGYNGVPSRMDHCIDKPCPGANVPKGESTMHCIAIHAEQNAVAHCRDLQDAYNIYLTDTPCMQCLKLLLATNIQIIYACHLHHTTDMNPWRAAGRGLHIYEI